MQDSHMRSLQSSSLLPLSASRLEPSGLTNRDAPGKPDNNNTDIEFALNIEDHLVTSDVSTSNAIMISETETAPALSRVSFE